MIDDHAHPFDLHPGPLDLSRVGLDVRDDPEAAERRERLRPTHLWHALLVAALADRLGCRTEEVADARAEAARDYRAYVRGLFADAGIEAILMDPAWPPDAAERLGEYEEASGCGVHWMFRLEPVIDGLLEEGAGFDELVARFDRALEEARAAGCVALKTILAYRTGLRVRPDTTEREAREAGEAVAGEGPVRRRAKPLRDFLLRRALAFAADAALPLQVHTGFGDSDIRLSDSNPLLLEDLLDTPEGRAARVVLIHGAYPYHEEAAFLATTHPGVHVDVSLFNLFAPARLADRLLRIVELAPAAKVLAGTDGYGPPETYWFAATLLRRGWKEVRASLAALGARDAWVRDATRWVFEENARRLYGL